MLTTSESQVKTNRDAGSVALAEATLSRFWLVYFLVSIAIIGFGIGAVFYIPLKILSFLAPFERRAVGRLADLILARGIGFLMRVQPWFHGEIQMELPRAYFGRPLGRAGGDEAPGLLLVSNHRSHLDAFILLSTMPGIRILAKRALFFVPFLNVFMWLSGQISVARGDIKGFMTAMEAVTRHLKRGHVVHVFPEMTRCERGFRGTQSFSLAPFHAAKQAGAVVVPIVFSRTDDVWPKSVFGLNARVSVSAHVLTPLSSSDFSSVQELRDEARRLIDQALVPGQEASR